MKKTFLMLMAAALGILVVFSAAAERRPASRPVADQMKAKLAQSQEVLKGLALEDFDLVERNARRLRALVDENLLMPAVEYNEHAVAFKRNVNALIQAASRKNIDAATLAYVGVTMNCVECHKALRGRKLN